MGKILMLSMLFMAEEIHTKKRKGFFLLKIENGI